MILGKNLTGPATFTFDYFTNGGFIGCRCADCGADVKLPIQIYQSGKLMTELNPEFKTTLIQELLDKKIIHPKDPSNHWTERLSDYVLWNMDARFELLQCTGCRASLITIFGMDELQPGREEVQFKGIWKLNLP